MEHWKKQAQVFQQSATFFKNLANYAKDPEYGDPTEYDIKVTREGTGYQIRCIYYPGRNSYRLDDEALDAVKGVDLIDAVSKGQGVSNVFWLSDFISSGSRTRTLLTHHSQGTKKPKQ
jgi:hypothetical protein